jgi:hypothetical protein
MPRFTSLARWRVRCTPPLQWGAPGGFEADFSKVGSAKHRDDILEDDAESPSQNDVTSVVDQIEKDKQCLIYWYPDKAHSFEPLKEKPSNEQAVLFLSRCKA